MGTAVSMSDSNLAKKFRFGNSFDISERGMVAARDFTLADVELAKQKSFEEGKVAGAAEQREQTEHLIATAIGNVAQRMASLESGLTAVKSRVEIEALETVTAIAKKLLPAYAAAHGFEEIKSILHDCLCSVYDEPRIAVRVHDSVLEDLRSQVDGIIAASGFTGKVVLFPDPSLTPSDCRVEWADGGTERDTQRLWREIESSIESFLSTSTKAGANTSADSGSKGPQS